MSARQDKRSLAKKIKGMSESQVYTMFEKAVSDHTKRTMDIFMECLHEEYGFGEKRINRLIEVFNEKTKAE